MSLPSFPVAARGGDGASGNGHLTHRSQLSHHFANREVTTCFHTWEKQWGEQQSAQVLQQLRLQVHAAGQTQARRSQQLVVQADQLMSAAAGRHHRAACSAEVGGPSTVADSSSTCPAAGLNKSNRDWLGERRSRKRWCNKSSVE